MRMPGPASTGCIHSRLAADIRTSSSPASQRAFTAARENSASLVWPPCEGRRLLMWAIVQSRLSQSVASFSHVGVALEVRRHLGKHPGKGGAHLLDSRTFSVVNRCLLENWMSLTRSIASSRSGAIAPWALKRFTCRISAVVSGFSSQM